MNDDQKATAGAEKWFNSGELCDSCNFRFRWRKAAKKNSVERPTEEITTCRLRTGRWHFRKHLPEYVKTRARSLDKMKAEVRIDK
jgi:hypothetical protein